MIKIAAEFRIKISAESMINAMTKMIIGGVLYKSVSGGAKMKEKRSSCLREIKDSNPHACLSSPLHC